VVCMTDRRNTAVLPCRHVCLCTNCANIVRSQPASKCPICRSQVDSLMQLVGENEGS
jgi:rRNA maturation endonuclease Nob1